MKFLLIASLLLTISSLNAQTCTIKAASDACIEQFNENYPDFENLSELFPSSKASISNYGQTPVIEWSYIDALRWMRCEVKTNETGQDCIMKVNYASWEHLPI